jgi:hypothetical protein
VLSKPLLARSGIPKLHRAVIQSRRPRSCRPDSTLRCIHRRCVPASWTTVCLWRDPKVSPFGGAVTEGCLAASIFPPGNVETNHELAAATRNEEIAMSTEPSPREMARTFTPQLAELVDNPLYGLTTRNGMYSVNGILSVSCRQPIKGNATASPDRERAARLNDGRQGPLPHTRSLPSGARTP